MEAFPNPEREWERPAQSASVDRAEIERRLGPTTASLEVLGGGRANLNVRVGLDRVLRIYRRDPASAGKEKALLMHPWESFAVPTVLGSGEDFLVLAYVAHGTLGVSAEHGAQTGRALAEIHRRRVRASGFLGADLEVRAPFADVIQSLESHLGAQLERAPAPLRARVAAFVSTRRNQLVDAAGPPVLLHGDFKASNLHWTVNHRLLVLDWEFAYSGPALMDIGQLLRWNPPAPFVSGFAGSYRRHGGVLPEVWERSAGIFDLFNLAGLLAGAAPDSRQFCDVRRRIERTLAAPAAPFVPPCQHSAKTSARGHVDAAPFGTVPMRCRHASPPGAAAPAKRTVFPRCRSGAVRAPLRARVRLSTRIRRRDAAAVRHSQPRWPSRLLRLVPPAEHISPNERQGGTWDAFFWVRDVRALHAELRANGAEIVYGPIVQDAYHMEEFAVRDREGYVLGFAQALTNAGER